MNKSNALIILDWDDTLFPTTWTLKKRLNLNNKQNKDKYLNFFNELDTILYDLLINFMNYGTVVIVTNAMTKWVIISSRVLPNTRKLLETKIKVVSAREIHQKELPNDMFAWKKLIFKNLVDNYYKNNKSHKNIISVGDADYEFKALINLWKKKDKHKYLKTIRLLSSPSYESLLDQLNVLKNCTSKICQSKKHMDLKFDVNN